MDIFLILVWNEVGKIIDKIRKLNCFVNLVIIFGKVIFNVFKILLLFK